MARYWEPFTTCLLGRALLPFLLNITTYIEFLSRSLSYISNYSYSNWLSSFSTHPYFARAPDRIYQDASLSGFTDIDLWAQSISDPSALYHPQDIPATCADAYYRAAEVARQDGSIRHRMDFHRPLFGGLESDAHVSAKQAVIRQRFKSAVDRFNPLSDTDRAAIYDRALVPAFWYYNFFLSEEFALIKKIYSDSHNFINGGYTYYYFTDSWALERTLIICPDYVYDIRHYNTIPHTVICTFPEYPTTLWLSIDDYGTNSLYNVRFTLIEFY